VKVHLIQQRMLARSTQTKTEPECSMASEPNLDDGIKTHCIYAAVVDAGQIYTDQTGRFPVISSKGNVSIMVLYEYDVNAIMAESIKNNKAGELLCAFQVMEQKLTSRGLKPKRMTLDNEALQLLKVYLHDQDINFQLVPTCCHRRNAAERAICSFKDHLISGLCSTDKAFPNAYVGQTAATGHSHTTCSEHRGSIQKHMRQLIWMDNMSTTEHLWHHQAPKLLHIRHQIAGAHGHHMDKMGGT
jgi:hypothetical protein